MSLRTFVLAVLGLVSPSTLAAQDFAWSAPIRLEGRGGLYAAEATAAFYAGVARADLGDVRVRNAAGENVPHSIHLPVSSAAPAPRLAGLPIFPLWAAQGMDAGGLSVRIEQRPGGAIVGVEGARRGPERPRLAGYLVDATAFDERIEALHLDWEGSGFAGRVRVEASDDLARWTTRVADAPVMALAHDGQTLAARRIAIPGTRAKYLRLSWPADQETPAFRAVHAEPAAERAERARTWQAVASQPADGGRYELDLGGHPPVDRLRVELPMNAVLPVEAYSRRDRGEPWRLVAATTLYRLERGGAVLTRDELAFPPRSDREWMVKLDSRAGVAGGALRIQAGYVPHRIVFAARGDPPFNVVFGSARATPAALPLSTLVPGYGEDARLDVARALLEAPQPLARAASRWPAWLEADAVDRKRLALWAVLAAGVALLGVLAWRLARQVS